MNGIALMLYNLHLQMPLNEDESQPLLLRYHETVRNQQIVELLSYITLEDLPVIAAGDFNMSEYSPVYNTLRAQLTDVYRSTSWGIGATWPAGESEELGDFLPRLFRLDYVWITPQIQAKNAAVATAPGSDHLPLLVELIVPAPATP